jgi:hypothetical protein
MSVSPTRSVSPSPRRGRSPQRSPSNRRRGESAKGSPSPVRSPTAYSPRKFDSDEWPAKKPEQPKRRGCAFIQSERGCRKGNACTFSHDPADVADPRWHKCAGAGCSNLCRGTFCPRCRNRLVPARRERSRSPARPKTADRQRSRSRERKYSSQRSPHRSPQRSRHRHRSEERPRQPAFCSQCGRRY